MIKLVNVTKKYGNVIALDNISMTFEENSFTAITGPSGCGKTTLLNILAGYDRSFFGKYYYNDDLVNEYSQKQMNEFYRSEVGTVFQEFHLLSYLSVYENISLPAYYSHRPVSKADVNAVLEKVDLMGIGERFPDQLSGGQKQRVAIARLLMQNSRVLLADEPTGALDRENGIMVMNLLKKLKKEGMTVILVTHDREMAQYADTIYRMENGHVVS
ncbi:MAG: ABC transporter ATP-binding protein [Erysipelotrichaceae bacterium]|nr:ABC transporter ATP-binding protein [Erysipelotrichaceae bacterium]